MLPSMPRRLRGASAAAAPVLLAGAAAAGADLVQDFIGRHWRQPLAPQGPPPARFSPLEASLHPESCGTRHPAQFADWRESVPAAASGPGVLGQLVEMRESDPSSAHGCLACHAPLAEQGPFVAVGRELRENPDYDAALTGKGVPCAGSFFETLLRQAPAAAKRRSSRRSRPRAARRSPFSSASCR